LTTAWKDSPSFGLIHRLGVLTICQCRGVQILDSETRLDLVEAVGPTRYTFPVIHYFLDSVAPPGSSLLKDSLIEQIVGINEHCSASMHEHNIVYVMKRKQSYL